MKKGFYDVKDIQQLLDCGRTTAYKVIRELNNELKEMGSLTVSGKIPIAYFHKRYKGLEENE